MNIMEQTVKKLLDMDYTYEHLPQTDALGEPVCTGYVYFKADDLFPILNKLGELLDGS